MVGDDSWRRACRCELSEFPCDPRVSVVRVVPSERLLRALRPASAGVAFNIEDRDSGNRRTRTQTRVERSTPPARSCRVGRTTDNLRSGGGPSAAGGRNSRRSDADSGQDRARRTCNRRPRRVLRRSWRGRGAGAMKSPEWRSPARCARAAKSRRTTRARRDPPARRQSYVGAWRHRRTKDWRRLPSAWRPLRSPFRCRHARTPGASECRNRGAKARNRQNLRSSVATEAATASRPGRWSRSPARHAAPRSGGGSRPGRQIRRIRTVRSFPSRRNVRQDRPKRPARRRPQDAGAATNRCGRFPDGGWTDEAIRQRG